MRNDERVTYFAQTDSRNKRVSFGIKAKDRSRHMYVIGKTGMGKSTLLENMAIQDVRNGEGMAFIDPHGKSADLLLDYIPKERIKDVLYFAPFDMEYPVGFNVMEDVDPDRRHLVVNGLMSTFEKIWEDAWSARMSYILQNTIHALLEYPDATLLDVNRMYTNKEFRKKVVDNIEDPSVKSFWVDEYAKYTDRYTQEATPAIQNKIGQLAANPVIRNIVGQPRSSFDIRKMMDERKILIINLSKGKMGELNATLLGSMIINKIYLSAMSRADVSEDRLQNLPNFYAFVDEFQSFANRSFADILSESRKYKLNLTMAHQYIEQMSEEVRAAVFGNVGTLITFRVGAYDAETLEKEFAPKFIAEDIVNLGFAQIYLKLMIDGVSSPPFSAQTLPPIEQVDQSYREEIIQSSREFFAGSRLEIEKNIRQRGLGVDNSSAGQVKKDDAGDGSSGFQSGKNSTSQKNNQGNTRKVVNNSRDRKNNEVKSRTESVFPNSKNFRGKHKNNERDSTKKESESRSNELREALANIKDKIKKSKGSDAGKNHSNKLREVMRERGVISEEKEKPKNDSGNTDPQKETQETASSDSKSESKHKNIKKTPEISRDKLENILKVDKGEE